MFNRLPGSFMRSVKLSVLGVALLAGCRGGMAQLASSAPIADPADQRFQGVAEIWTTPALTGSNLRPVRPVGFVDDSHS
jgi:hypothetical protein